MELSRPTATFAWGKSVSPSFDYCQPLSFCQVRRSIVWCISNGVSSAQKEAMTVLITGATGFIGRQLVQRLQADKHNVNVLTNSRSKAQSIFPVKDFPQIIIAEEANWKDCIQGSNAVVNEKSPSGNDYLAEVCREWEASALRVNKDVRLALIHIGVVLGKDGGALAKMIPLFMMFVEGPLGSDKQWFYWIHIDDIVGLIYDALSNPSYKGVINGTAPNPVRLGEMCEQPGTALGRPSWLPVPEIALKTVLGEGANVVLEGQKVIPTRAQELGFTFRYPRVKDALRAIISE